MNAAELCPNMLKTNKNPVTCGQRYVGMNELDEVVWISVKTVGLQQNGTVSATERSNWSALLPEDVIR